MNIAHLTDRAIALLEGKDAESFLQGLITNDIALVAQGRTVFTALLSPQGKFLFDFFIVPQEGGLLLDADKATMPGLLKRLSFYRLRAAVTWNILPDYNVAALWGEGQLRGLEDPRLPALGNRLIATQLPIANASPQAYDQHRITLGIPDGAKDLVFDRSLLLAYGYDALNAVSFTKGCYVGQEVTARSKHRATLRRVLFHIHADAPLPPQDTSVLAGEEVIGELLSTAGNVGLALLEHEGVFSGKPLTAKGTPLQATKPSWWH